MRSSSLPRRRGAALVVILLILAVAVTAGLSFEVVRSARAARTTVEGVLRDYASMAAIQFAREAQARLDPLLSQGVSAARHRAEEHLGAIDRPGARGCDCAPPAGTKTLFAVAQSEVAFTHGEPLPAEIARDLMTAVAPATRMAPPSMRLLADGRLLVTAPARRQGEPVTAGFVAEGTLLHDVFACVLRDAALLPHSLVDAAGTRDVLTVRVAGASGAELFRSGDEWSEFARDTAVAAHLGGWRVAVAIKPERASTLVIGGLPSDRRGVVAGLLVLAVGLVSAAVVQLRREIRFARQRADFVSGVSHELRTPLAQIRLFGETLLLGRVRSASESQRAAAVIVQEARRLSQMVDNVLTFSRVGRGTLSIQREPIDPARVVRDVVDTFRSQATSKQATIEWTVPADGLIVDADPNALRQVLLNLLDNAVKYGPRGQTVRVTLGCDASRVTLVVEDEGPGVRAEDTARVWQPFWRAPGSSEGGTGLGLAIVRELVELHGGTVGVTSGRSGGAIFTASFAAPGLDVDVVQHHAPPAHLSA